MTKKVRVLEYAIPAYFCEIKMALDYPSSACEYSPAPDCRTCQYREDLLRQRANKEAMYPVNPLGL